MTRPKILALIAFRDEEKPLPGFFSHLRDYVNGFIAFNDCSSDRSLEIARAERKMVDVFESLVPSSDHFFETQNRLTLLRAAHKRGAQWVLCGDADERFETRFLRRLPSLTRKPPAQVMGLRFVALWDNLQQHRVGNACKHVLFPAVDPRPYYPPGRLHQPWFPPSLGAAAKQILDYYLYHLGSLTRQDRLDRYHKFQRIDPHLTHQPQGYDNLIDESDLRLAPVLPERAFRYE